MMQFDWVLAIYSSIASEYSKTIIFLAHFLKKSRFQLAFFNIFCAIFYVWSLILLKQLDYSLSISMR